MLGLYNRMPLGFNFDTRRKRIEIVCLSCNISNDIESDFFFYFFPGQNEQSQKVYF